MSLKEKGQGEIIRKRFKFARWATWVFLVASILLLAYTYYRAKITSQGSWDEVYFKYYLISLAGVLFWGIVLRLKDESKLNVVMVTTSLVVGIYLLELILLFLFPLCSCCAHCRWGAQLEAAQAVGVEFDTRTKYQVIQDLKGEGVDAVPWVEIQTTGETNGVEGVEPLVSLGVGVSGKTTVTCNESGEWSILQLDRYGFNNPDSEWDASQTEWLVTGDSFTQGVCVNPGEGIAGQIRSITGEGMINLGAFGNGPLSELAALKEYAESRKPKIVLWIYFEGNDLQIDLPHEKSIPLLMSYLSLDFSQNLMHRQPEIDGRLGEYLARVMADKEAAGAEGLLWKTRLLRLYNIRKRIGFDAVVVVVDPLFTEILTKVRDRTAAWGGKLYFVYLPEFERYATEVQNHNLYRKRSEVIEVVKKLNLPVIDIHQEVFANHPDPLSLFPFRMNGHYNAEGNIEIAKAIVSEVRNDGGKTGSSGESSTKEALQPAEKIGAGKGI